MRTTFLSAVAIVVAAVSAACPAPPPLLSDGVVGAWGFAETAAHSAPGGADFADTSSSADHGVATASGVTFGQAGKLGTGVALDGAAGVVTADDKEALHATSFTVSAWFNITAFPAAGGGATVVSKPQFDAPWSAPFMSWMIRLNSSTHIEAAVGSATDYSSSAADFTVPEITTGAFHHVVLTYDGANVVLYVDGAAAGTQPFAGPVAYGAFPVVIGGDHGAVPFADFFPGTIDEVVVWNRGLAATEVVALNNGGAGVTVP